MAAPEPALKTEPGYQTPLPPPHAVIHHVDVQFPS